ncbi:extracellular solute-binding protein [Facklamia sp. DSM 111018]|uniref:Extracellular solute-binding protein n=1 Tax=Facklamia lactis TaxID=2749967 RepID=A0ABS0LPH5_9LACT|nr:extracellular solute-binding protein [Facklamia lactis]MBG9980255.1 extracellular solute-binding protein [Facklamia lactis]MBG9986058.1 extracellular solute-binding protein [Facklamia lactis]
MKKVFTLASAIILSSIPLLSTAVESITAQEEQTVVVYSNTLFDEAREARVTELAKEAGFKLEVVAAPGGDTYNRVLAEKDDPQADVVIGLDEANWLNLQEEIALHDFEPVWAENIPEAKLLGSGQFFPFAESYIFGLYNPDNVSEEEIPKRLEELGESDNWKEKYRIPEDLAGSTHQKILLTILMQYPDENGDLGISEEGWQKVENYINNGYQIREDEDHFALLNEGTLLFDYHHASGTSVAIDENKDYNIKPIDPEYGVFTMTEEIGILDKGKDHDYTAAEGFVNWFGSDEIQKTLAEEFGFVPLTDVAKEGMNDTMKTLLEQVTPMEVDWDLYRENVDAWVEKLELDYMP